jgi:hypothetical protein
MLFALKVFKCYFGLIINQTNLNFMKKPLMGLFVLSLIAPFAMIQSGTTTKEPPDCKYGSISALKV